jgi:glycosyltransferase involved in cell wall biosynthesis
MRVLLVGRYEGGLIRGGAEVQLELTRDLLRAAGHEVEVVSPEVQDWGDLVHFFGIYEYFWSLAGLCQEKKVPYVVSSIWYEGGSRRDVWVARKKRELEMRYPRKSRKYLRGASRILVPSDDVKWRLESFFDIDSARCDVVPSGAINGSFFNADFLVARQLFGLDERYAVCVGNFLERKNQLNLIRAMKGVGLQVVFAGSPSDQVYYDKCVAEAKGGNFRFLGKVEHDRGVLASLVAGSVAFLMPSRLEDFLIAGVETGALGKPIVLGSGWNGPEIYGEHALFADPDDIDEIRAMSVLAFAIGDSEEKADWFRARYSEEAFLERTLEVYRKALE